jgi:hypothetical protein
MVGVVEVEVAVVVSVVTTGTTEMVVDEVILKATAIQMTGRSEERKIGLLVSGTITVEMTVDVVMEIVIARAVVDVEMIEDLTTMSGIASAKRKIGMSRTFLLVKYALTKRQ